MRLEARAALMAHRGIEAALALSGVPAEQRVTAGYYLTVMVCNVPAALLAEALGCSRNNISKALGKVEDRRDADPQFGAAIDALEAQLMGEG